MISAEQSDYVYQTQTATHWTTLATLIALVKKLGETVKDRCEKLKLDFGTQKWVLTMDCYSLAGNWFTTFILTAPLTLADNTLIDNVFYQPPLTLIAICSPYPT